MPDLRIPRRSGVHRIAAVALYRALLSQCRAAPITAHQRDEVQNIVRNRFKQAQHSHSIRRLKVAFEAGYQAIDQLDAAVAGNDESKSYILSLLERAPAKVKLPPATRIVPTKPTRAQAETSETENSQEPKRSILDRPIPLEQLTGRRHVPVLFSANRIPVLRIKKPQPASLSGVIRKRLEQRQARLDRKDRLNEEKILASREDEWDDLVEQEGQNFEAAMMREHGEPRWTSAITGALYEVEQQMQEEKERRRVMVEKMQAVVDRETELFKQEGWKGPMRSQGKWKTRQKLEKQTQEGD